MKIDLEALDYMHAMWMAYRDDKFGAALKKLKDERTALDQSFAKLAADKRDFQTTKKEADVVLKSQETFNKQHEERMAKLKNAEEALEAKKAEFASDVAEKETALDYEKRQLDGRAVGLAEREKTAKKILATREQAEALLADGEAMKAQYEGRLKDLGLKAA